MGQKPQTPKDISEYDTGTGKEQLLQKLLPVQVQGQLPRSGFIFDRDPTSGKFENGSGSCTR